MMKHEISALMDGELFEDEADSVLGQIKREPAAQSDWAVYHMIGDVLRQPEYVHRDISAIVRERLQNEPTILAPRSRALKQKARVFALSAAASLLAVGVVSWMSLQISPETAPQMAMQQSNIRPVNMQIQPKSNDYLMAHQEFSPSNDMNGGASYIRTVTFSPEEKSQ
ncbi:MAG: anti-sigma factor [Gallionellales bacterium RIFOXYD12_FULL_53_10]|jgi:sigma-E factor negative regulatory protein RseA|uniref:Anti sigma-E protein RseA family protein n=1 Tax=Gallionella capsiferriformans (strain ES-2) TaxID=395494 RepID=D9SFB6_GALCS|nr:sigma-E factor negative regulatory protein [Gallionella capsiferriformans]ADL55213.1 Anti sigma-E protein RseA family protein [Gallionella capsiferriformans ES-2]OGS68143.1 MAG: anti-sigma factor [Gallionellales bacterium GWA2_54_124]OGT20239.1 MAG: anti-sigma factor [Gallionellales bacterium RIFOXYD12_FULL_53_10]